MGGVEGRVVRVRGSVVDVDFAFALPALRTILMVESQEEVPVEVIAHVDDQTARCVASSANAGDGARRCGAQYGCAFVGAGVSVLIGTHVQRVWYAD